MKRRTFLQLLGLTPVVSIFPSIAKASELKNMATKKIAENIIDPNRGTGRTTELVRSAPHKALFLVRAGGLNALTKKLGRLDLIVAPIGKLTFLVNQNRGFAGGVVIDHAVVLDERQQTQVEYLRILSEGPKYHSV